MSSASRRAGRAVTSAARAAFTACRSLPIRWRLAGGSAVLTLTILLAFAIVIGELTTNRIRANFNSDVQAAADNLVAGSDHLRIFPAAGGGSFCLPNLDTYASSEQAVIRVLTVPDGNMVCATSNSRVLGAADSPPPRSYAVASRLVRFEGPLGGEFLIQYARPYSAIDRTIGKVWLFLSVGVLGGAALALLAGLGLARRAMAPIARLTSAARDIERTRDPSHRLPVPAADDEVAELAATLDGMLQALDAARGETEAALERQRELVADASHELRTPLTSVLANLELLAEQLDGEQAETANAALRSTRRMRRLVGDLLLLARADAGRHAPHRPTDLAGVVLDATAELGPVARDHELALDTEPVTVLGAADELHRLVLNLIQNAVGHTPPGTHVNVTLRRHDGEALLTVEDDGPGIPEHVAARIFERFVRGAGERAGSSGLGLAIVKTVAEIHHGRVSLERPASGGTRFVVHLPALERAPVAA